jgi:hypothetical protein
MNFESTINMTQIMVDVLTNDCNVAQSMSFFSYRNLCLVQTVHVLAALYGALYMIPFTHKTLQNPLTTVFNALWSGFLMWVGAGCVVGSITPTLRGLVSILLMCSILYNKIPEIYCFILNMKQRYNAYRSMYEIGQAAEQFNAQIERRRERFGPVNKYNSTLDFSSDDEASNDAPNNSSSDDSSDDSYDDSSDTE